MIHRRWVDVEEMPVVATAEPPEEVPLRPGEWLAPSEVRTDSEGTMLVYPEPGNWRPVTADRRLLAEFLMLESAPAEAIRQFASRRGVLELCDEGWPFRHSHPANNPAIYKQDELADKEALDAFVNSDDPPPACDRRRFAGPGANKWCWESIDHWRQLSSWAYAIVQVSEQLRVGLEPAPATLRAAFDLRDDEPPPRRSEYQKHLAGIANTWLALGGHVRITAEIGGNGLPRPVVDCAGLFAALGQELLARVVNPTGEVMALGDEIAFCSECHRAYVPKRKPAPGKNNYCHRCGEGDGHRAAKRRYARTRREKARESSPSAT